MGRKGELNPGADRIGPARRRDFESGRRDSNPRPSPWQNSIRRSPPAGPPRKYPVGMVFQLLPSPADSSEFCVLVARMWHGAELLTRLVSSANAGSGAASAPTAEHAAGDARDLGTLGLRVSWWGQTVQPGSCPLVDRARAAAHWRSRRSQASRTQRQSRQEGT
jgi:hypothetical protein